MTTHYRPRYAESDAVWADLHGIEAPAASDTREHCSEHGPYTPTGAYDHQCPDCERARLDAADTQRAEAWRRWASSDWHDRADAHHDAHD